jgi:antitoxin PrlF
MKRVVTERGRVTIPKVIRDRLGIRPGTVLDFVAERGRLVARKVDVDDPVGAVYGILKLEGSTDELIDELRGKPHRV